MRLFIAIQLGDEAERHLERLAGQLRQHALGGSFTRRENLHLTLAFLGETHNRRGAERALETIRQSPFSLTLEGLGRFSRRDGDIAWAGIQSCSALSETYRQVADALRAEGFPIESRPFRPHITLGRRVVLPPGFDYNALSSHAAPLAVPVTALTLMQSSRIDGRLTYTSLYRQPLLEAPQ